MQNENSTVSHTLSEDEQQPLLASHSQNHPGLRAVHRRRNCTLCAIICGIVLLVFVFILAWPLYIILLWTFRLPPGRFTHEALDLSNESFGVGFDLTAGYATAAISFRNGTIINVARVEGDDEYNRVMKRFSMKGLWHATPPYHNESAAWEDFPRQIKRWFRTKQGKPASDDVAVLANMLKRLKGPTEKILQPYGELKYILVTAPQLEALYNEDLVDACNHVGIQMLTILRAQNGGRGWNPVSEVNTAFAGSGLGLCPDFLNETHCYEQLECEDNQNTFSVLFTRKALVADVTLLCDPRYLWASIGIVDFPAGFENSFSMDGYWDHVQDALRRGLASYNNRGNQLKNVVSFGEEAENEELTEILRLVVSSAQDEGYAPRFVTKHPVFAGARGAAEMAKRCMMLGWDCTPDLAPKNIKGF